MAKSYLILVVSSQWKGKNSKYQGLGIGVPSFGSRSQFVGKTLVKYCKTIANNWQRPYIHWNMLLKVACPSIFQPIIGSFLLWFGSVVKYLSQCTLGKKWGHAKKAPKSNILTTRGFNPCRIGLRAQRDSKWEWTINDLAWKTLT